MRIAIGFLNFGRPLDNILNIVSSLKSFEDLSRIPLYLATNDTSRPTNSSDYFNVIDINKSKTVAFGKNQLLNAWHKDGIDVGIIIEDDIIIKDVKILGDYAELVEKYNIGIAFCGYGNNTNRVFMKPNPRIVVTTPDKLVMFNSMPDACVQVFNLKINKELFNENLMYLEQKEYLSRLKEKNLLPFLGVYIDINESWKVIHSDPMMKSIRPKNQLELMLESNLLKKSGLKYEVTHNLQEVIDFSNKPYENKIVS